MNRALLFALPLFALPLFALALAGCPDPTDPTDPVGDPPAPLSDCRTADGHGFEITDADTSGAPVFVENNALWVDVAYGGGCEEHTFVLCWPDGAFAESEPVQANLEIWHGGPVDSCEAYLHETLELDLTPLKDAWHASYGAGAGTITINLAGASESLEYTFE